jgi:hypothetical protein
MDRQMDGDPLQYFQERYYLFFGPQPSSSSFLSPLPVSQDGQNSPKHCCALLGSLSGARGHSWLSLFQMMFLGWEHLCLEVEVNQVFHLM